MRDTNIIVQPRLIDLFQSSLKSSAQRAYPISMELPRFDGHFSRKEGKCLLCQEQGTRTLRNSGIRLFRLPELGVA